jgi:N-formylglutamate deformylase
MTLVLHVPHSSLVIPPDEHGALLLDDLELQQEMLRMTDAYTDELFNGFAPIESVVRFPVSRLIVDPERFEHDADEPMAARGMRVVCEKTALMAPLRASPSPAERDRLLAAYYRPHHAALSQAVDRARAIGACLIIDAHSFPSRALPYELDQGADRPDFCIGTDAFHTPDALRDAAMSALRAAGFSVAIDRPFAGTIVPMARFRSDASLSSIMIEVNRRLYMNEETGARLASFSRVRDVLTRLVQTLHGAMNSASTA